MRHCWRPCSGLVLKIMGGALWGSLTLGHGAMHTFDMTYLHTLDRSDPQQAREAWDTAHLVSSLQGIVNRDGPVLFVRFMPDPDDFWWAHLQTDGQWLAGEDVVVHDSLEDLLRTFDSNLKGLVVYDERVWATSNLASTIAGVEDRACLRLDDRPGSIYQQVMGFDLDCTQDVTRLVAADGGPMFTGTGVIPGTTQPSSGSAKCDAYLWAKAHYLDTGRCSNDTLAYYLDSYWLTQPTISGLTNATLTNHDYYISKRAFFFDLHVWEEESPVDDPDQSPGTDVATLRAILSAAYAQGGERILQIGGFTPWAWKYTNHGQAGSQHGGVDTEWKYAQVISEYNGIMDADALGYSGMANASFYRHHPLRDHYPQNPRPTTADLQQRGLLADDGSVVPDMYVCFYMGDYDAAAWLNYHVPLWWQDEARSTIPCAWAFNPNLDGRAPHVMHYVRTHQSPNDWFTFGDSGAGYLNPGMLLAENRSSGIPDGLQAWTEHCLRYAQRYDLSITGFIIDGHSPPMGERGMDAYTTFSGDGLVGQNLPARGIHQDTMPYVRMAMDLHGAPADAGRQVADMAGVNGPKFVFIRTILKSPSWHRSVMTETARHTSRVTYVDPYTFFALVKLHETGEKPLTTPIQPRTEVRYDPSSPIDGLAPIRVADGIFNVAEIGGVKALHQQRPERLQYVYFEVSEALVGAFEKDHEGTVRIAVEVLDSEPGKLGVQYDSKEMAYRNGRPQMLPGSGTWRTVEFELPGAHFQHRENGGADWRLLNWANELWIRSVRVWVD